MFPRHSSLEEQRGFVLSPALSIHQVCTYRWSLEQDLKAYAELGIRSVGIWRQKLSDYGEEQGAGLVQASNLQVSSYHWVGGFTGSDVHSYEECLEDAIQTLEWAAKVKAGCLVVHPGARGFHMKGHLRRLLQEAFSILLPKAAELGIALAIEPIPLPEGEGWTVIHGIQEAIDFVQTEDVPGLKILLDLYHQRSVKPLETHFRDLVPHLACVQIADAAAKSHHEPDRLSLGKGTLPLKRWIQELLAAGYEGVFELELVGPEIEQADNLSLLRENLAAFAELVETR